MSFLNCDATIEALPRVIDIMGEELDWSETRKQSEFVEGIHFMLSMGVEPSRIEELSKVPLVEARRWRDGVASPQ